MYSNETERCWTVNLATYHLILSLGLLRLYLHFRTACCTGEVLRHRYHYF